MDTAVGNKYVRYQFLWEHFTLDRRAVTNFTEAMSPNSLLEEKV